MRNIIRFQTNFQILDFESYERDDTKIADWRFMPTEWDWCEERMRYTSDADEP